MAGESNERPAKPLSPRELETPGLVYRPRKSSWVLLWSPRSDLVDRGYPKTVHRLWPPSGVNQPPLEPTHEEWEVVSSWCEKYQTEMLLWANGGVETDPRSAFDGTIKSLSSIYQTDPDSPFKNLRFHQRLHYARRLRVIEAVLGEIQIKSITFRDFKRWHKEFAAPLDEDDAEHEPRAYDMIAQLRLLFKFGKLALPPESGCAHLCEILAEMEFKGGRPRRKIWMNYQQASLVCAEASRRGFWSIALAQAFQTECGVRQKDMIGEWVPLTEPGMTDIVRGQRKWLMGARWEEIDHNMVWQHRLSKSVKGNDTIMNPEAGQIEEFDLLAFPLIMDQLHAISATGRVSRGEFPVSGPIIVYERTSRPWSRREFCRHWRTIARAAGIPDEVQNRDSRPGAATEAELAGAHPDTVRRLLGHARGETTEIYRRGNREVRSNIAKLRAEKRK